MTIVLDSRAVLRLLEGREPVASKVEEQLSGDHRPVMSWINAGEVYYVTRRSAGEPAATTILRELRSVVDLELPSVRRVIEAARIKADHHMAYADAFAAVTAMAHHADLWTGDPEPLVHDAPWRGENLG